MEMCFRLQPIAIPYRRIVPGPGNLLLLPKPYHSATSTQLQKTVRTKSTRIIALIGDAFNTSRHNFASLESLIVLFFVHDKAPKKETANSTVGEER